MTRQYTFIAIGLGLTLSPGYGQVTDALDVLSPTGSGLRLYGASVSTMFYSGAYGLGLAGLQPTGPDSNVVAMQSSAVFGWSKHGQKSNISITYSPSYVRAMQSSHYDSWNHSFSITANRTLTSKWSMDASVRGVLVDFSQLFFARTQYANIASAPGTFQDLAGAVLTGQSENQQLTDLVNAAPLVNSPETAYVYGGRELSVAGALSLSYARSSRSTYRISADVTRAQSISEDAAGGSGLAYALPRTTSAAVDFGWSYSLTPRTTFSLDASETRTMSSLVDVHITRANASIGKTLNTHWFIQGMIGVGKIDSVSSSVPISQGPQQEWSGSVGYKLYAHTFLASVSRQAADTYGLGANANLSGNGAWTWKRPGSNVSIFSSFAFLHLVAGPLLQQSGSWQARAGFERSLGRQTSFTLTYSYVQYPRALLVQQSQAAQSGLMATLNWSPVVRR